MARDYTGVSIVINQPLSIRQIKALIVSVLLAVVIYLALSLSSEWEEVIRAYKVIGFAGVGIALMLSMVNYGLRFCRWQLYLYTMGHRVAWKDSALVYLSGFSLTTTPGKAGEMLRSVFLKPYGVSYVCSTAAFISERLSDLFAIVVLCMLGVTVYTQGASFVFIGAGLVIVAQLILSSSYLLNLAQYWSNKHNTKIAKSIAYLSTMLLEARRCHTLPLQALTLVISLLAWSAEAYAFYLLLSWVGVETSYAFAFFVYAVSMLAGAISFLPGGLGSAEATMIGLLLWIGVDEPQAIAATVVIRLATLWFAVALGCSALMYIGNHIRILDRDNDD